MSRALTDATVRNIQAPGKGRIEVRDPACRGLELRVTPTGAKTFAFRFRDRHSKRVERITLGRYPSRAGRKLSIKFSQRSHRLSCQSFAVCMSNFLGTMLRG